jgi:hypothetical protein
MPESKRQRKAKPAKVGSVENAPLLTETADSRSLRNGSNGETHQRAGANLQPRPGTEQLEQEENLPLTLRLRNGVEMDARWASAEWRTLDSMRRLPREKHLFKALADLTFGEGGPIGKATIDKLTRAGYLDASGAVRPLAKHILESCFVKIDQGREWLPLIDKNDVNGQLALQVIAEGQPERMLEAIRLALQQEQSRDRGK